MANFHWRQNVKSRPSGALPVHLNENESNFSGGGGTGGEGGKGYPQYPRGGGKSSGRLVGGNKLNGGPIYSKTVADISENPELIPDPTLVDNTGWTLTNMAHDVSGYMETTSSGSLISMELSAGSLSLDAAKTYNFVIELVETSNANLTAIWVNGADQGPEGAGLHTDFADGTNSFTFSPSESGAFEIATETGAVRPLHDIRITNVSVKESA